jgi:hypothetical protein
MPTQFSPAPDVQEIAERYIEECHRHLIQCGVKMVYLFRDDVPVRLGKRVMGEAKKVTGLNAFFAAQPAEIDYESDTTIEMKEEEPFFCLLISKPIWDVLTLPQREALVDHELSHCWAEENDEGEVKLMMLAHDLGEFNAVVRRHGLWQEDVEQFLKAASRFQGELRFDDDGDGNESSEDEDYVLPTGLRPSGGVTGVSLSYRGKTVEIGKSLAEAKDNLNKVAARHGGGRK